MNMSEFGYNLEFFKAMDEEDFAAVTEVFEFAKKEDIVKLQKTIDVIGKLVDIMANYIQYPSSSIIKEMNLSQEDENLIYDYFNGVLGEKLSGE